VILPSYAIAWPTTRHKLEKPLEIARDDLDDATHSRQDAEVLKIAKKIALNEPSDLTYATMLLITIISVSKGLLDPKYNDIPDAIGLINAHPQLMQLLKTTWEAKSFRDIRNLSATFN
jgi:hypothetical protein